MSFFEISAAGLVFKAGLSLLMAYVIRRKQ